MYPPISYPIGYPGSVTAALSITDRQKDDMNHMMMLC